MSQSSSPEAKAILLRMARSCPHLNWMLLELPTGQWAAFWKDGFEIEHTESVAAGDYSVCYTFDTSVEALAFMVKSDHE
jgi:hypothetical protein